MKRYPLAVVCSLVISLLSACSQHRHEADHASDSQNKAATVSLPLFTSAEPRVKDQIRDWLKVYFTVNQALINDRLAPAKSAVANLLSTTNKVVMSGLTEEQMDFYFIQSAKLKTDLLIISQSTDIEQARSGLAGVSEAMYALVKAFRVNTAPLYYQYCPMARNNQGATWLSETEELLNPYMGQLMLNCGRTQEKLN
ncbi:DUF3347 domain-containing protein [Spirosoma sp. BT702]|uniref:DUF3347 domain-containing protein n=1 Tax=Spirosoma profusum TaxID=2771354 RepID=A0A926XWT8_9BACT|nr:DUF3347 domain-containing protein [Spirosoma profusum]MBD2701446.1 DUF3347 domain-containing protein [Spirosoma profusum]